MKGHEVQTAVDIGWADLDDAALLDAMEEHFDVLVTVDKSLPKQQQISRRPFAVIVLRAKTNRLADLLPLVPYLLETLDDLEPGHAREISM